MQRQSKEKEFPSWKTRPDGMEKLQTMKNATGNGRIRESR